MDVYIFFSFSTRRASPSTSSDVGLRPWYKIGVLCGKAGDTLLFLLHCMWNVEVDKLNYVSGYTEYHLQD